jgi:hypothetical protein
MACIQQLALVSSLVVLNILRLMSDTMVGFATPSTYSNYHHSANIGQLSMTFAMVGIYIGLLAMPLIVANRVDNVKFTDDDSADDLDRCGEGDILPSALHHLD